MAGKTELRNGVERWLDQLENGVWAERSPISRIYMVQTAFITISQSLSGEVDLAGYGLVGLIFPTAWTAASLSFQASDVSGGTFYNLRDDTGTEISVAAAGSVAIGCDVDGPKLAPFRFLRLRSGVAATTVPQAASIAITLILKT